MNLLLTFGNMCCPGWFILIHVCNASTRDCWWVATVSKSLTSGRSADKKQNSAQKTKRRYTWAKTTYYLHWLYIHYGMLDLFGRCSRGHGRKRFHAHYCGIGELHRRSVGKVNHLKDLCPSDFQDREKPSTCLRSESTNHIRRWLDPVERG